MLTICTSRTTGAQDAGGYTVPGLYRRARRPRYLVAIGDAQVPRYGSCKPAGTSHSFDLITGNSSAGTSFDGYESESSWKLCTAERGPGVCEMLGQISRARGSQVMIETGMR